MTTALDALRAARACILQDRTSFAECNVRDDGSFEEFDAEALAEYDAVLAQIDEALASEPESEPVAWGWFKDGELYDAITPECHAHREGAYTVPLYTHPSPQPAAQPEPGEWVTVPREPTTEMLTAGSNAAKPSAFSPVGMWAGMISAAPPSPHRCEWIVSGDEGTHYCRLNGPPSPRYTNKDGDK